MIYQWILYGAGGFVVLMLLLRLVTHGRKPFKTRLLQTLMWSALAGAIAYLSLKVSLGFALMMLVLAIPLWRGWVDQLGLLPPPPPKVTGKTARLNTRWLEVVINQDAGTMQGRVTRGELAGWQLHELDKKDLKSLHDAFAQQDPESLVLFEKWLDRHGPALWRHDFGLSGQAAKEESANKMTRTQALEILGLEEGAEPTAIKHAHKRLMMKNHPDQGGSTFLASQINRAKDELLNNSK